MVARRRHEHGPPEPGRFPALRIPISNQRASRGNRIAGISPFEPDTWCGYLGAVRSFWAEHDWLDRHLAYLYPFDEPGPEGMKTVAEQAATAHRCWAGSKLLVTGNPSLPNRFLWDDKGGDDVDIWSVLSRRYYGEYNHPREKLDLVARVRARGADGLVVDLHRPARHPRLQRVRAALGPADVPALERARGDPGDALRPGDHLVPQGDSLDSVAAGGEYVLVYPGQRGPIASARLEQIRDGIEDWAFFDAVRRRRGASAVRTILAGAGLFSATAQGVKLACTVGCELPGPTKYSWPQFSHDAATAAKIEAARVRALKALG